MEMVVMEVIVHLFWEWCDLIGNLETFIYRNEAKADTQSEKESEPIRTRMKKSKRADSSIRLRANQQISRIESLKLKRKQRQQFLPLFVFPAVVSCFCSLSSSKVFCPNNNNINIPS